MGGMEALWRRRLHSEAPTESGENFCYNQTVSYTDRVDNPAGWNWCLVPDGGYDAVFFAGMAIVTMAMASPRWDALISLFAGGVYQILAYYYNLGHVSNAVNLWLGMRPADIFVYVFLPPFLLDLSVRIDFFMLKKMIFNVMTMAFAMVITTCLVLIPFMLYALDLKSSGWDGGYVALFGAAIASTDAAAVCAALAAGGAPEILSVLLEGESLFNDASSLTLFEIFKEVVEHHESKPLGQEIGDIIAKTLETALVGIAVGIAMGIFNKYLFVWLQHRNMPDAVEVGFTVGGAYLSFYITQVWCKGSGCVGTVAYGLYGSATLLWGMSNKVRQTGIFQHFWKVMIFIVNALIFFYVGASCVNFTIRSSNQLYDSGGGAELTGVILYKLPLIYLFVFAVRGVFLFVSFKLLRMVRLGGNLSWQEITFLALGGLRGSLSLVLAQTIATLTTSSGSNDAAERVKAEAALYTAGFVIMTMLINAPLSVPLMTLLKLNKISKEQLLMRGHVKDTFFRFTSTALEELQGEAEDDEMLQGVDWPTVEEASDFQEVLDRQLPEEQPCLVWRDYYYPQWLRSCFAWCGSSLTWGKEQPMRAMRSLASVVDLDDLDGGSDADDRAAAREDKAAAREEKARLKGELGRMTAWTVKQEAEGPTSSTPRGPVLIISDSDQWGELAGQGQARSLPNPMRMPSFARGSLMKSKSLPRSKGSVTSTDHGNSTAFRTFNNLYHGLVATGPAAVSKIKAMTVGASTRAAALRSGEAQQARNDRSGGRERSGGKERNVSRTSVALAKINGDLGRLSKAELAKLSKSQQVAYSGQSANGGIPLTNVLSADLPRNSPGSAVGSGLMPSGGLTGLGLPSSSVGPSDEDFRRALSSNQQGLVQSAPSPSGQLGGVRHSVSQSLLETHAEARASLEGEGGEVANGATNNAQVALTIFPELADSESISLPAPPNPLTSPPGGDQATNPERSPVLPRHQRTNSTSTRISRLGQSNSNLVELGSRGLVHSASGGVESPRHARALGLGGEQEPLRQQQTSGLGGEGQATDLSASRAPSTAETATRIDNALYGDTPTASASAGVSPDMSPFGRPEGRDLQSVLAEYEAGLGAPPPPLQIPSAGLSSSSQWPSSSQALSTGPRGSASESGFRTAPSSHQHTRRKSRYADPSMQPSGDDAILAAMAADGIPLSPSLTPQPGSSLFPRSGPLRGSGASGGGMGAGGAGAAPADPLSSTRSGGGAAQGVNTPSAPVTGALGPTSRSVPAPPVDQGGPSRMGSVSATGPSFSAGVDPQADLFLAGSQAALLVIKAPQRPSSAVGGGGVPWKDDVDAKERQDILRSAMSHQQAPADPHHRIVQRRMGDGSLATTSMYMRPQGGRANLARTSLDASRLTTPTGDFPAPVPEDSTVPQRERPLGRHSQLITSNSRNARGGEVPWGPSSRASASGVNGVNGNSPGPSLGRSSRALGGADYSGPLGRQSRAPTMAGSDAAPLGRTSQRVGNGETPLGRASRPLGRASRSTQFFGEVTAADGGQTVFSSTPWENGGGGGGGGAPGRGQSEFNPEVSAAKNRMQLLRTSVGGARMGGALGRGSVGAKFFSQAQAERQLASSSAILAQTYLETGEEPLHEDLPYMLRDPADLRRSSRTGVPLMRTSQITDKMREGDNPDETRHEMLMEYRLRLLTGLKSYFKGRFTDGVLSPQSYKVLWYITSKAHHMADRTLALWDLAKQEVSSSKILHLETQFYYWLKCRINDCRGSTSWWRRQVLTRLLTAPAWLLSQHLSSVQLAGLEAAVELWISLTSSLQTQWLQYSGQYGALVLQEVTENAEGAWSYIVDRRIEEPEKFQAIQTYRASVHLISQQLAFVEEMSHGGMIDEKEALRMEDTMQKRLQRVCRAGPQWRRQSVKEILAAIPFLRNIHPKVVRWIRSHSTIKVYGQGECIWEHWASNTAPPGMFIVLSGVVRLMIQMHDHMQPIFLGSGGVGGLIGVVLEDVVQGVGMRAAYAEGNAMGKGPVVMHIPRELFVAIQRFSRVEGLATWQQLELNIYRTAAAYVLDLLRGQVVTQLGTFVRSALAACVLSDRLDSKVARRQRIRALLKDAFENEGHETTANHLDWVSELLNVPRPVALALLDGSLDFSLANAPWHKAMFQAIAASTNAVYDLIRASVRESWLVVLAPGQTVWQTSTMVLIQGSLTQQAGPIPPTPTSPAPPPAPSSSNSQRLPTTAAAAPQPAAGSNGSLLPLNGHSGPLLKPPHSVSAADLMALTEGELAQHNKLSLVMEERLDPSMLKLGSNTPSLIELPQQQQQQGGGSGHGVANGGAGAARAAPAATFTATPNNDHVAPSVMVWTADYFDVEVPVQPPVPITAGIKGATLLVWGVDPNTLLTGVTHSML